ncbi:MAG: NAD(P)H-quinone oxidoreductase [Saprospiraceae bacterium]|nr:NAD(P)H-quinone oxidoreductase [Saprospiraceae bacterium]
MKAILYNNSEASSLRIGYAPDPEVGEEDVLIEVAATALNRADIMQRQGLYPPPAGASPILGLEVSGVIIQVGNQVSKWKIGDRVCALLAGGGYAERVSVHQGHVLPVPDHMDLLQAAAIPEVFLTAYQALVELGRLAQGEHLLVHAGASGVGTAAIQLAKKIKAHITVTASKGKHDLCLSLGAHVAIDYKNEDFLEQSLAITKQQGMDVIIDFIGAPYFESNITALNRDGRLIVLAFMGGYQTQGVNLATILMKRLHIMGSTLRARSQTYKTQLVSNFYNFAWSDIDNQIITPVVDSVFSWHDIQSAHQMMEGNKNAGKIIIAIKEQP